MTRDNLFPSDKAAGQYEAPPLLKGTMRFLSRFAPGLAARLAADLFMRPLRPQPRGRELKWLEDARPEVLPTRHGKMAGWSWGQGPVVVLIHGWNGRGSQMGFLARVIAGSGFRAVVFDGPAHGRSPGRRTNLIIHSAALVDVCKLFPDLHGIVGHSFGALSLSFRWTELPPVNRLIMISPPADMSTYSRMFIQAIGVSDQIHHRMIDIYQKRYNYLWDNLTVENLAPGLEVPLLVIHDRDDRQAPFSHGQRTRDTWTDARLLATEGLGHMRILRNEAVAKAASDFLAAEPPDPKPDSEIRGR